MGEGALAMAMDTETAGTIPANIAGIVGTILTGRIASLQ